MSTPRLLEELLDHVVDHLHDERANLENCCLVSRSWIPRARKHLFSTISLRDIGNLQSWKNAFPDPSSSPARYTKTLAIGCPEVIAIEDVVAGGLLSAFSRVTRFAMHVPSVGDGLDQQDISLIPFHGLFPAIRSLRIHLITFPSSPIFNLICSFPTLENLQVEVCKRLTDRVDGFDVQQSPVQTLNPPAFSGSLKLQVKGGWNPLVHPLLSLPSGIHFRSLCLALNDEKDVPSAVTLVERCHSTLESLKLSCGYILEGTFSGSIDLSKAKNLKHVAFSVGQNPRWIIPTLRTVSPDHENLQQISLDISFISLDRDTRRMDPVGFKDAIGGAAWRGRGWSELDLLLAQLRETHSIRPEVTYTVSSWVDLKRARSWVERFLPEVSTRGIVDLIGKQRRRTIQGSKIDMIFDMFLREEWGGRAF